MNLACMLKRYSGFFGTILGVSTLCALMVTPAASANEPEHLDPAKGATGIAVYASYLDTKLATQAANRIEQTLLQTVQQSAVSVNGSRFLRLQSTELPSDEARALVEQAKAAGYSAWFAGATHSATQWAAAAESATRSYRSQAEIADLNIAVTEPLTTRGRTGALDARPQQMAQITGSTGAAALHIGGNPELAKQLPRGPLLGDLYPPRLPLPAP